MDIAPTTTSTTNNTNTNTNTPTTKSPDLETETPTRIQPPKPLSFTNGVLKRHTSHHHHHLAAPPPVVIIYKECLKNHAATLGGHALDGCGEFMPSPTATHTDPTSLKCAACGCHRNFHRREPEDSPHPHPHLQPHPHPHHPTTTTTTIEYQPHHRHHPPPPPPQAYHRSPNSASPPPISSSYPSAPHMLLALSGGMNENNTGLNISGGSSARKRFRTKFSQSQKERMHEFAERVGWKIQKRDEDLIQEFCNEVGVDKGVLKVWMHNNKNTLGKRDGTGNGNGTTTSNNLDQNINHNHSINNNSGENVNHHHHHHHFENDSVAHVATNGSSSSS